MNLTFWIFDNHQLVHLFGFLLNELLPYAPYRSRLTRAQVDKIRVSDCLLVL